MCYQCSSLRHIDGLNSAHQLLGVVSVHHEHRGSTVVETLLNFVSVGLCGVLKFLLSPHQS